MQESLSLEINWKVSVANHPWPWKCVFRVIRWLGPSTGFHGQLKNITTSIKIKKNNGMCCLKKLLQSESVLPSSYKVLTNASSGRYNWRLVHDTCEEVVPRLQGPLSVLI